MQVSEAVAKYREASPELPESHAGILAAFAEWFEEGREVEELGADHIAYCVKNIVPRQVYKRLPIRMMQDFTKVIVTFLLWCAKKGLVAEELPKQVEMPEFDDVDVVEILTRDQLQRLVAACKQGDQAARDIAILAVLVETGMSAFELCDLTLENVFIDPGEAYINVFGKGGHKSRKVWIGENVTKDLGDYIYVARRRKAPKEEQHVFLSSEQSALTPDELTTILHHLRDVAQLQGIQCNPDTFRQTSAVHYLKAGGDIYGLTVRMGFTEIEKTENFIRAFPVHQRGDKVYNPFSPPREDRTKQNKHP